MLENKLKISVVVLTQCALVAFFSITNESLWIDEFATIGYSNLTNIDQLFSLIRVDMGSQTPLYYFQMYFWEKCFGHSEYALRMSNLPFFMLAQAVLLWTYRKDSGYALWLLLTSSLYPLLWVYLNEARPYITMYAGSTLVFAYISSLYLKTSNGSVELPPPAYSCCLAIGALLLAGSSLLGAFWVLSSLALIGYRIFCNNLWRQFKRPAHIFPLLIMFVFLFLLAAYYIVAVFNGGGASRLSTTNIQTLGFAAYELLGYSGLGPGRIELRESAVNALVPYALPLSVWSVLLLLVLFRAFQRLRQLLAANDLILILVVVFLPMVIISASGFLMHWRVLGRHLIPFVAVLIPFLALGFHGAWACGGRIGKVLVLSSVVVMAYSAISMVLAERHGKDDYRAAALIAKDSLAHGKVVWWVAATLGPYYYELPVDVNLYDEFANRPSLQPRQHGTNFYIFGNGDREFIDSLNTPDIVLFSKADIFDRQGFLLEYLNRRGYILVRRMQAFTVWEKAS